MDMDNVHGHERPMQLTTAERTALRKIVRSHPDVLQHVSKPGDINALPKEKLIAVAEALRIDIETVVASGGPHPMEDGFNTPEARELSRYSQKYPGFTGVFEFELAFELFGQRIVRKARIDYSHTPDWEYYDLHRRELMNGWDMSSFGMEVLVDPSGERQDEATTGKLLRRKAKPEWVKIDILNVGVLPNTLIDDIYARIDQLARAEDAERRARLTNVLD